MATTPTRNSVRHATGSTAARRPRRPLTGRGDPQRPRHLLRELLLSVGAALGVLSLLAATAAVTLGMKPLVFRSGSMSPAIEVGALGLARSVPATELKVGDVVSVINPAGTRITHRISSTTTTAPPVVVLTLKGDANQVDDADTYPVSRADRVFASVDKIGYLVGWLSSPPGVFAGGLLVGALLMYAFGHHPPTPTASRRRRQSSGTVPPLQPAATSAKELPASAVQHEDARPTSPGPGAVALLSGTPGRQRPGGLTWWASPTLLSLGVATLLFATAAPLPTQAAFTDTSTAATGTFSTRAKVATPALACGTRTATSVQFTWASIAGVSGYEFSRTTNATTTTTNVGATSTAATRTATTFPETGSTRLRAFITYTGTTWYSDYSTTRNYRITNNASTTSCT